MKKDRFYDLLNGYITGELTIPERVELSEMLSNPVSKEALDEFILEVISNEPIENTGTAEQKERIYNQLKAKIEAKAIIAPETTSIYRKMFRYAAAAVLLIAIAGTGYFTWHKNNTSKTVQQIASVDIKKDVPPGKKRAVLTLADGTEITLDSTANGLLAQQGDTKVINENGVVSYKGRKNQTDEPLYNTLSTSKGEQSLPLTMSDGSKVWLNAASSIKFPVTFTGNKRMVEITGEVYFEIAHNAAKPFIVKSPTQEIQVLGTKFNVNSYSEENAIRTTLLEGSVKITANSSNTFIKPGEQAVVEKNTPSIKVAKANIDEVMSWKNGFFSFKHSDIESIMRQLSRWYDVEIKYEKGLRTKMYFSGEIDRNLTLSQVLKILEQTKVHFKIEEGKRIIILP